MTDLAFSLPISFDHPAWLWVCLLVPVLVAASMRSLAGLDGVRRAASLLLRSLLIVLLAACLAGIEHVRRNRDLTVMFLMDRSHSVEVLEPWQEQFMQAVCEDTPPDDRVGVISFARSARLEQLPMRGGYYIQKDRLSTMGATDRTDLASALRLAMAMFPHDTTKRMVLLSDGNDNMGDVLSEARRARADGVPIDVLPLRYQHPNEIYIDRMLAPTFAEEGEQVPIRLVLHTGRRATGRLQLYHNNVPVPMPEEQSRLTLVPGDNTFFTRLPIRTTGTQHFEARFLPDDEAMDAISLNNTAGAFTLVSGASTVLLVTADPTYDAALAEALRREQVRIDVRTLDEAATFTPDRFGDYSSIILANVPANALTDEQHAALVHYVKHQGGGLIMTGGDEGFGAGGWIGSPVAEVMPVHFEIKHKRVIPRGALVLIMHSCEAARGNFHAKEMAKKSADTISSRDYFGVLAYSYSPGGNNWEVPLDLNTNRMATKAKIDRMQNGDMPDFGSAMEMAYKELMSGRGQDAAQRHVIIFSDGDASGPSQALLARYKTARITVSTVGIGYGAHVDPRTLQQVATATGGRYYQASNPRQLPQIFVKESKVVRRPLLVEEPFQPMVVQAHTGPLVELDAAEQLPRLGGFVMTSPKEDPNVMVPVVRQTQEGDDPVLAHWQCELGKAVAFTSGYWPRWGREWTQWSRFAKFWAQLVRWSMRQEAPANFDTSTSIVGDQGRIVVDALDERGNFLNHLQLDGTLLAPDGQAIPVIFNQLGPGQYEVRFQADKAGPYVAAIRDTSGRVNGILRTGLTVPFSPEFRDLKTNDALLDQIASISGGRRLDPSVPPAENDIFRHDLPPVESRRPTWNWVLAWLALPVFLLDVAVRRLASWVALSIAVELVVLMVLLFGCGLAEAGWSGKIGALVLAELIGWSIRFRSIRPLIDSLTYGAMVLSQAGDRSATSLRKLRSTRDKVREGLDEQAADAAERRIGVPPGPEQAHLRRKRFDVGDARDAAAPQDLTASLGGARAEEEYTERRRPPAGGAGAGEGEDATSRLLRAKRRAQRGMDGKEKDQEDKADGDAG
jgi:Mg-chelatase subunit ChlD